MINLRVASATTAMLFCVTIGSAAAAVVEVQYRSPAEQTEPSTPVGTEGAPSSDREPRIKERTPPPRPIVPPEGQQQNPALREDCAWLGQRIVSLLLRDDPMTGNDFVPFYQRFGCPPEHLSKAFGCVVECGSAENDVLADRVAQCWTDPATPAGAGGRRREDARPRQPASCRRRSPNRQTDRNEEPGKGRERLDGATNPT